ncbi:MAG: hypothetical protein AAF985_26655 [Bacteroidota bacterium]
MKKGTLICFSLMLFLALDSLKAQNSQVILRTDFEGQIIEGSIDSLISKISEGKKVRVGWQLDFDKDNQADLEHWIDANFISIINGHVYNQIDPIYRQIPTPDQVQIINSKMQWTAIIGTNGKLLSRYIIPDLDAIEDEAKRAKMAKRALVSERMVATIWAITD